MVRRLRLILMMLRLILMVLVSAGPAVGQVAIANTPAGQALSAWLDAFNSGDRAKIDVFVKTYSPRFAEAALTSPQFRGRSGGVDLVAITRSERLSIAFRVHEKTQPAVLLVGKLELDNSRTADHLQFHSPPYPDGSRA